MPDAVTPADAVCYFHSPGGRNSYLREMTLQLLCARNDAMADILKVWCHIRKTSPQQEQEEEQELDELEDK